MEGKHERGRGKRKVLQDEQLIIGLIMIANKEIKIHINWVQLLHCIIYFAYILHQRSLYEHKMK